MPLNTIIADIRNEAGITQDEMARRLYVTRQAISRWENGDTAPGIDMVKLIALTFDVPIERFFDMPMSHYCQCCSMPLTQDDLRATNADGTTNADFCKYCYDQGDFTLKDVSMDEFIERTAPMEAEALGVSLDEAVSLMATLLPHLKRWKEVERNEERYGKEVRAAYGDETMDAANEKYVRMGEEGHTRADQLELAIKEQLRRAMEDGATDGEAARQLVDMHRRWICAYWPDGMYTAEAHKALADGYLADERFKKYYEQVATGATQFLRDAIHACA